MRRAPFQTVRVGGNTINGVALSHFIFDQNSLHLKQSIIKDCHRFITQTIKMIMPILRKMRYCANTWRALSLVKVRNSSYSPQRIARVWVAWLRCWL